MSPLSPAEALNRFSDPAQVQLQAILQKRSAQAQAAAHGKVQLPI